MYIRFEKLMRKDEIVLCSNKNTYYFVLIEYEKWIKKIMKIGMSRRIDIILYYVIL